MEKNIVVRVSESLKKDFYQHCAENGFSVSKRIRILLERDVKHEI